MRIQRFVGIIGIVLFLASCNEQEKAQIKTPTVLIPEDKMADILGEVHLIEAYLAQIPYNDRGDNDSDYVYFPIIFEKYQINKQDFLDNLAYYSQNEQAILSIYDKSIILLNKLKAKDLEIRLQMKMDSLRKDSIQNAELLALADSLKKSKVKTKKQ